MEKDNKIVTDILLAQLKQEGIQFILNGVTNHFISANEVSINVKDKGTQRVLFDAVFVSMSRELQLDNLKLQNTG